jgi:hypothetical protein
LSYNFKHLSPHQFRISTLGGYDAIPFGIRTFFDLHLNWVMMQINIKHIFNNVSQVVIFRKLCDVGGTLANIVPFTRFFYDVHPSLYYQHGQNVEGVTIIESFSSTK